MKLCSSEKEYIEAIAPAVRAACARYGYLPSVLIAQSCLENGYALEPYFDNPGIAVLLKYNNMVGMKSELLSSSWADKTVWPGDSLTKQTPEEYNGKKVIITDSFRIYDDIEQSFADFLLFLTYASNDGPGGAPKYGSKVLTLQDPEALIKKVSSLGYATDSSYAPSVMRIINKHGLTKYDDLTGVKKTVYTPGYKKKEKGKKQKKVKMPVGEWPIKKSPAYNQQVPARGNEQQFITVHYLGVDGQNNELWDGGYGAHYVVYWDGTIYKVCDHDACPYQVGTAGGAYIQKHPTARNYNCIGIEMCCHNPDGYCPETAAGEKHWYFTEATQRAAAFLVRKLMEELGLDISHVLRHYDVVNKNCPAPYVYNNRYQGSWTWDEFLEAVKTGYCPGADPEPAPAPVSRVSAAAAMISAVKNVADTARREGWTYGDSHSKKPCADRKISCDRLIARALHDMGFRDQRAGGETCGTLDDYFATHGWEKTITEAGIEPGAVVAVKAKGKSDIDHVFCVSSYNKATGKCIKYDTGSNVRIQTEQPFKGVPLVEWVGKEFACAWNPPAWLASGVPGRFVYDGVDYGPVFNAVYYRKLNPDLAAYKTKKALFDHFIKTGMKEGRQACAGFCVHAYRDRYDDLKKAFKNNLPSYYKHFCLYGQKEGRCGT